MLMSAKKKWQVDTKLYDFDISTQCSCWSRDDNRVRYFTDKRKEQIDAISIFDGVRWVYIYTIPIDTKK